MQRPAGDSTGNHAGLHKILALHGIGWCTAGHTTPSSPTCESGCTARLQECDRCMVWVVKWALARVTCALVLPRQAPVRTKWGRCGPAKTGVCAHQVGQARLVDDGELRRQQQDGGGAGGWAAAACSGAPQVRAALRDAHLLVQLRTAGGVKLYAHADMRRAALPGERMRTAAHDACCRGDVRLRGRQLATALQAATGVIGALRGSTDSKLGDGASGEHPARPFCASYSMRKDPQTP